jgi:TfoX/Sxy family transcriptional regulator of competence genes
MAKKYLEKLSGFVCLLKIEDEISKRIEVKHFFSGAALYVNEEICVTWSPVGLAFKLPEDEVNALIDCGKAKPLKYFPKGHIKKSYALFENPDEKDHQLWKEFFIKSARQVS